MLATMNQEQPQEQRPGDCGREPIKYGDVFDVSGELASKSVAPQDAALMQTAEAMMFGQTQKGGPAAAMHSAAAQNERAGFVARGDVTDVTGDQGVAITETELPGIRTITESVAGQVIGQQVETTPVERDVNIAAVGAWGSITIGEALEAAGYTKVGKAVDQSDASAIQAAEVRATGTSVVTVGSLTSTAQSAAAHNEAVDRDEDKIKLGEVLKNATSRLPVDKVVMKEDAEGVASAELMNKSVLVMEPGGVAASVAVAARLNEGFGGVGP